MSESNIPDPLERLINEVRLLFNALVQRGEELHEGQPLSMSQRAVLEHLLREGPSTVPQIARRRRVSRQHIQMLVNPLLDAGWIERAENPDHKRSHLIQLTAAGQDLISAFRQREGEFFRSRSTRISSGELIQAAEVLRRLRAVVEI